MKHERFDTTDRDAAIFMAPAVAKHYGNPAPFAAEAMILIRHKEATRDRQAPAGEFRFHLRSVKLLSAFNHEERMQIIRRVHNLLTPGGLFAFSAHNRY